MVVHWPVELMVARTVPAIPDHPNLRFEAKMDGYRAALFRQQDKVVLQSRQQRSLTRHFSDVAEIAASCLAPGTVLDGELVVMNGDRIDFAALQRRATSSRIDDAPATFVAFDLLAHRGDDTPRSRYRVTIAKLRPLIISCDRWVSRRHFERSPLLRCG
jgi:ATP-dependent DNA ligase